MYREDRLVDLLVRFEDAVSAGTPVTPETLCRECPDLLPDFLQLLKKVGVVNAALEEGSAGAINPEQLLTGLEAGRYRLLGFHDAGGMGVVFTAEDDEVGRMVALKCLPGWAAADSTARARFLMEAEVTGRLEHPGVVPVYGLGRDRSGHPYYAMRFISGTSLRDELLTHRKLPADAPDRAVEFGRLLRAFTTVCETVAYAHARGVIHRDLKPGNIMLGPYGEALLVDWGLAKRVGVPDPEATVGPGMEPMKPGPPGAASMPGVAKGTPAYMSPEQARGETARVGPASDVFGLGATLYAILTGRAPYEGPSAQALARDGRFTPPRQLRRAVPRPLEAICLKAMAVRPEDRYAGAKDLARDVERWLADEPVSAWREPFAWRARRWMKRHRTAVASILVAAGVTSAALAVGTALLSEKNAELGRKNHDLEVAYGELRTSNAVVEDNLKRARLAMRELTEQALGNPLLRRPGMAPAQQALLAISLRSYLGTISAQRPDDPEVQAELAFNHYAVAVVADSTGKADQAVAEFERARALLRPLRDRAPPNPQILLLSSTAAQYLSILKDRLGDTDASLGFLEEALGDIDRFADLKGDEPARVLQFSTRLVGWEVFARAGKAARAAELRAAAATFLDGIRADEGDLADELRVALASGQNDLGTGALRAGRFDEAENRLAAAAALCRPRSITPDMKPLIRLIGVMTDVNRAELLRIRGRTKEALELCARARELMTDRAQVGADVPQYQLWAAEVSLLEGSIALQGRQLDEAEKRLEEARRGFEPIPGKPEARAGLARVDQLLSVVYRNRGKPVLALARGTEAVRRLEVLCKEFPGNSQYRLGLAAAWNSVGVARQKAHVLDKAVAAFEQARQGMDEALKGDPENPRLRHQLALAQANLGHARSLVKAGSGLELIEQALAVLEDLVRRHPEVGDFVAARDLTRHILGMSLEMLALDRVSEDKNTLSDRNLALMDRAGPLLRAAALATDPPPDAVAGYESHLRVLGILLHARGEGAIHAMEFAEAVRLFQKGLVALETLEARRPADDMVRDYLVKSRSGLILGCQGQIKGLDPATEMDRRELVRLCELGLATVDKLPPKLRHSAEAKSIAAELRDRLAQVSKK